MTPENQPAFHAAYDAWRDATEAYWEMVKSLANRTLIEVDKDVIARLDATHKAFMAAAEAG